MQSGETESSPLGDACSTPSKLVALGTGLRLVMGLLVVVTCETDLA
jgi:hypothetical protein